MSRKIITNNKDSWQIHSSISDNIIFECNSEKELRTFITLDNINKAKLEAIKDLLSFPNGWVVNDVHTPMGMDKDTFNEYNKWWEKAMECETYEEYYAMIEEKLQELLNM
jgi:hypothetical protein